MGEDLELRCDPDIGDAGLDDFQDGGLIHGEKFQKMLQLRERFFVVLMLKSLNNTFHTRHLIIPFKPNGLKVGRPVATSSSNLNTNKNVSGSQLGSGVMSAADLSLSHMTNGNFDSRVLSRNHAMFTADPVDGNVYIRDLKSSNGTFLNKNKLGESNNLVKVGDVIDFGTDIDAKFQHKKISALVANIVFVPLLGENFDDKNEVVKSAFVSYALGYSENYANLNDDGTTQNLHKLHGNNDNNNNMNNNNNGNNNNNNNGNGFVPNGDNPNNMGKQSVNGPNEKFNNKLGTNGLNINLEETILGLPNELLTGIYINNSIGTTTRLNDVLRLLSAEVVKAKIKNLESESAKNYLAQFTSNLQQCKESLVAANNEKFSQIKDNYRKNLVADYKNLNTKYVEQMANLKEETENITEVHNLIKKEIEIEISDLISQIDDLKTRLEVEKFKNSQKLQKVPSTQDMNNTLNAKGGESLIQKDTGEGKATGSTNKLLIFGTLSIVALAFAYKTL